MLTTNRVELLEPAFSATLAGLAGDDDPVVRLERCLDQMTDQATPILRASLASGPTA